MIIESHNTVFLNPLSWFKMALLALLQTNFIPDIAGIVRSYFPTSDKLNTMVEFGAPFDYFDEKLDINYVLRCCCAHGVDWFISKIIKDDIKVDWEEGLCGACMGGNMEMVKKTLKMGAFRFPDAFGDACLGGNIEIVKMMIDKCELVLNWGLYNACKRGHKEIVNLLFEEGATDIHSGLVGACMGERYGSSKINGR